MRAGVHRSAIDWSVCGQGEAATLLLLTAARTTKNAITTGRAAITEVREGGEALMGCAICRHVFVHIVMHGATAERSCVVVVAYVFDDGMHADLVRLESILQKEGAMTSGTF